jgi:hypothetical protein
MRSIYGWRTNVLYHESRDQSMEHYIVILPLLSEHEEVIAGLRCLHVASYSDISLG